MGQLVDEGPLKALYPYPLLKNVLNREDCREAVLDETAGLEQEFGLSEVEPLYELLWTLNKTYDVCTSHTTISPLDYKSPFEWAKHFVGSAIIVLPRNRDDRHELKVAEGMTSALYNMLKNSPLLPGDTVGWNIRIFPTQITYAYQVFIVQPGGLRIPTHDHEDRVGYGHEIVISGSAGVRRRAAERWARAAAFVSKTLENIQIQTGSAQPYLHIPE